MAAVVVTDVGEHGPDVVWNFQPTLAKLLIAHGAMDAHRRHLRGEPALGEPLTLRRGLEALHDRGDGLLVWHEEREHLNEARSVQPGSQCPTVSLSSYLVYSVHESRYVAARKFPEPLLLGRSRRPSYARTRASILYLPAGTVTAKVACFSSVSS